MPIYAYRGDECGFAKDVLQKIADPVLTVCPNCGKATRIGHRRSEADDNGKTHSVRTCKRCNGDI